MGRCVSGIVCRGEESRYIRLCVRKSDFHKNELTCVNKNAIICVIKNAKKGSCL